jgi:predicted acetyltransferase
MIELAVPTLDRLPEFVDALKKDWSPDNVRGVVAAGEMLTKIEKDAKLFVDQQTDIEAKGDPIRYPDGTLGKRLPGFNRWIWDNGFCGCIGFRWQPGTSALPPRVLGHIGYAIVPWKQNRGYATEGLRLLLPQAKAVGLEYVDITADPDNIASQKVILANGGKLVERYKKPPEYGGTDSMRYRITLS